MSADRRSSEETAEAHARRLRPAVTLEALDKRLESLVDAQLDTMQLIGQCMGVAVRTEGAVLEVRAELASLRADLHGQRGRLDSVPEVVEEVARKVVQAVGDEDELAERRAADEKRAERREKILTGVAIAVIVGVLGAVGGFFMGHMRGLQDAPAQSRP